MSSKPEPQFQKGDPVWYESPFMGDRPATINERRWNAVTKEWTYRAALHDAEGPNSKSAGYSSEPHFRPRTPNE